CLDFATDCDRGHRCERVPHMSAAHVSNGTRLEDGSASNGELDLHSAKDLLTIPEAAAILRIGVNTGYELAQRFRATDGRIGLPNLAVGRRYIVPKEQLIRWIQRQSEERSVSTP